MSDFRLGVVSGSPAPDPATGLCTVTVDGTDVIALALGELPEAGWSVWVEQRGAKRADWVITDIQTPTAIRRTYSRYIFARTGLGIASGATVHVGTPPTTPWSTGSNTATTSTVSINTDCHFDIYHTSSGQGDSEMTVLSAIAGDLAATQGGGVYRTVLNYSGLLLAGETVSITFRNTTGGLVDLVARTVMTFCDAHWVVAQT